MKTSKSKTTTRGSGERFSLLLGLIELFFIRTSYTKNCNVKSLSRVILGWGGFDRWGQSEDKGRFELLR